MGPYHRGTLEKPVNIQVLVSRDPHFMGRIYDFAELNWTHAGTMLFLQQGSLHDITGRTFVLLRANKRPVWHPCPGLTDVRILVPLENPHGLGGSEMFHLWVASLV